MPLEKYIVLKVPSFIGHHWELWNISNKPKQEYFRQVFPCSFYEGQIVTKRFFKVIDGMVYSNKAIKKNLHIPKKPIKILPKLKN